MEKAQRLDKPSIPPVGFSLAIYVEEGGFGCGGDEVITAAELAARAQTIPWHLFTSITPRTPRFHHDPQFGTFPV